MRYKAGAILIVKRAPRRWKVHYREWNQLNGDDIGPHHRTKKDAVEYALSHVRKQLGRIR